MTPKSLFHETSGRDTRPSIEGAGGPSEREVLVFPVSFTQERLWFLAQMDPASSLYNIFGALRLVGRLDVTCLRESFNTIVQRHEILRTTFEMIEGVPSQVIVPQRLLEIPLTELQEKLDKNREADVQRFAEQEAAKPFDLTQGPLIRGRLLRLAQEEHVLLLTVHHIVMDGWSLGIFVRELGVIYEALIQGRSPDLPALSIQYADFAEWQREWLQGENMETHLAYWRRQLQGAPQVLALPTDRLRPMLPSGRGAHSPVILDASLTEGLKALSRREGCTLFMTVLAAYATLLSRYSGESDIVIGTPIANRTRAELEGLLGCFVNALPLRVDLSGNPTILELLRRVCEMTLEAYEHQAMPFEKLVEVLQPGRNLSHAPIFQVMLVLQNAPMPPMNLSGVTLSPVSIKRQTAKCDLTVTLQEVDGRLEGTAEYSTDLFDASTVERFARHFVTVLTHVVANPDERIGLIPLTEQTEPSSAGLSVTAGRSFAHSPIGSLKQWFERQVACSFSSIALVSETATLTYGELNARANQVAQVLRRWGVGPEVRVGVCLDPSFDLMIAILAIVKAGGAYVPVDPSYPVDRIQFMLTDAQVLVVVTDTRLQQRVPCQEARILYLDAESDSIDAELTTNLPVDVESTHLAYVIYTSGSTGCPKGVMVTQGNVTRLFRETQPFFHFTQHDVWTLFHSAAFDFSVWEFWGALLFGGRLVVISSETARSPDIFLKRLVHEGVTVLNQTPSAFSQLISHEDAWARAFDLSLRVVIFGGEALNVQVLEPWMCRLGPRCPQFVNMYGITETTVHVTYRPLSAADVENRVPSVIGGPIPDLCLHVLDQWLQPVPFGVPGELFVGGAGVARGYLGRPELTAERFIPDPFSHEPGRRLYRSGDRVRWRAEGDLHYIGRGDHQVKIRGYRIEPGEIESALRMQTGVQDATVVVQEDRPGEKRIVAYLVATPESLTTVNEIRQGVAGRLPVYMVPSVFVWVERIPLTVNGKVDRNALPPPTRFSFNGERPYVPPEGVTEEMVAAIWADLLAVEEIGREDNFFELGGHSLLATRVMSQIRKVFKIELPLRSLFEAPTVAGLAERIATLMQKRQGTLGPPLARRLREGGVSLSYAQERLWFLDQLELGNARYNVPVAVRLTGALNIKALEQSFTDLLQRHDILRTTFELINGGPRQVIAPMTQFEMPLISLESLPTEVREVEARRLVTEEAQRAFDLVTGPLVRVLVLRLTDQDHVLEVTMHHIIADGWSLGILVREIGQLYSAFSAGQDSPLQALPLQYADYAEWQREWLQGEVLKTQLAYWRKQLTGAPPLLTLPTDRPRPPIQTFHGGRRSFVVPADLTEKLKELGRQEGVTLFMTLLATFAAVLSRFSGEDDILIGSPIANRTRVEVEGLIGCFVNTLVLRTDLSGRPRLRELLARVREMTLGAYAHQDLPFEKLVEMQQPVRALEHTPLFQVMFILQNAPMPPMSCAELTLCPLELESGLALFDLTLELVEQGPVLVGVMEYNRDLFDEATVEGLIRQFHQILQSFVADPDRRLREIAWLNREESQQIVVGWNRTTVPLPSEPCVQQLFETHVVQRPESPALVTEGKAWSYRALNERANQLAHNLFKVGVGPEVRVALCVERSAEFIIAVLGILKAGGAYVPVDPGLPLERQSFMLKDAQVRVVVAQSGLAKQWSAWSGPVLCLEPEGANLSTEPTENFCSGVRAENIAYVMYTSGSTGRPKGVAVEHRALVNLSEAMKQCYTLTAADRVLQFASPSFDVLAEELFPTWASGAAVVLRPPDLGVAAFHRFLQDERVTVLNMPTAYWQTWVSEGQSSEATIPDCLRLVIAGSESIPAAAYAMWQAWTNGQVRWCNAYGVTEATVTSVVYQPEQSTDHEPSTMMPIGRPVANSQVFVLDQHFQPVPIGVIGELYIGGAGLARGYVNQPGLTAERFVPNLLSAEAGSRLYRTGDLVRYRADGLLEFVGRRDEQVKVRGYRIELGEIESVLREHHSVQEAMVQVQEEASEKKQVVAYVVPHKMMEAWPSVGEYEIYDELLYELMTHDERRTAPYRAMINQVVKDKVVVDIGTGKDAVLARFCAEAGAKRVYAIEGLGSAYHEAKARIEELGWKDIIIPILGLSTDVELPELADICVSEIIGTIGGSEGVVAVLNDARRLLKADGVMIPRGCVTKIAAVQLPDEFLRHPSFASVAKPYVDKIFEQAGHPFDLRVCLTHLQKTAIMSDVGLFEVLDFRALEHQTYTRALTLTIIKRGRLDGVILWIALQIGEGHILDALEETTSWLPVYFPLFLPGVMMEVGDQIEAECRGVLPKGARLPDYQLQGHLVRTTGERIPFAVASPHDSLDFKKHPFYQLLFSEDGATPPDIGTKRSDHHELQAYLREQLPQYMVPSAIVEIERLPLTPTGKIDRKALHGAMFSVPNEQRMSIAPRDRIELMLAGIWEELLNVTPVRAKDHFFELGGHSLIAVRLVSRIEKLMGKRLPVSALFHTPTLEALAATLRRSPDAMPWSPAVCIQKGQGKLPVFCVHPVGGGIIGYADLAHQLGDDQPFYGLEARGFSGDQEPFTHIEEMAHCYIEAICHIQPEGPYRLIGWSMGGVVAFEMAQQLLRQGRHVGLLAILDTDPPTLDDHLRDEEDDTATLVSLLIGQVPSLLQQHTEIDAHLRALDREQQFGYVLEQAQRAGVVPSDMGIDWAYRVLKILRGNEQAINNYRPQPYPGVMTLFVASEGSARGSVESDLGWHRLVTGGVSVHVVTGNHETMLKPPHVYTLAAGLNACLDVE